jgi:hypothetical protein
MNREGKFFVYTFMIAPPVATILFILLVALSPGFSRMLSHLLPS